MERTQEAPGGTASRADAVDRPAEARLVGSDRVPAVLEELARYPDGVGLEELTRAVGSPEPTVHRALGPARRADVPGVRRPARPSVP